MSLKVICQSKSGTGYWLDMNKVFSRRDPSFIALLLRKWDAQRGEDSLVFSTQAPIELAVQELALAEATQHFRLFLSFSHFGE